MKPEPSQQYDKTRLRREFRRRRAGIDPALRAEMDAGINRHLVAFARRKSCATVAAYSAFDGEPDLSAALGEMADAGVRVALPVIEDAPGKPVIAFRQWSGASAMRSNRFGIAEPVGTLDILLGEIDLALLPLVAWDASGGRLGMGASYYDRAFQPYAGSERPLRVGVGYRLQRTDTVPMDPWDVRLHYVLTESGCMRREEGS